MTQPDLSQASDADVAALLKQLLATGGKKPKPLATVVRHHVFATPLPADVPYYEVTLTGPSAVLTWRKADTEACTLDVYAIVAGTTYVPADVLEGGVLPESLEAHFGDIEVSELRTKPPKSTPPAPMFQIRNVGRDAFKLGPHVLVPSPKSKLVLNCGQLGQCLADVHYGLKYKHLAVELASSEVLARAAESRKRGEPRHEETLFSERD
jgi:hypothetical protein